MRDRQPFADRSSAGRALAGLLGAYADRLDVTVLALPRGGVPVAFEIAQALHAPLDVFIVRKLGVPGHAEYAMGALASGGTRVLNDNVVRLMGIAPERIERVALHEQAELARREQAYRGNRPPPEVAGRCLLVVDDGLATGATMHAAVKALRAMQPARIAVAVPVGATRTCDELRRVADEVVCARTPADLASVGAWYADFAQIGDAEVRALLERAGAFARTSSTPGRKEAADADPKR